MDEQLKVRAQALASKLGDSTPGSYENHLSKRLQAILRASPSDRAELIRNTLTTADQDWFQSKITGYAALVEDLRADSGEMARELVEAANQSRLEAQRDQDVIRELIHTTPAGRRVTTDGPRR
jgi:hypothetical protein